MKRRAAVAATGLVAAAGISLLGAGAASAATPTDGLQNRTQSVQQKQEREVAASETHCVVPGGGFGPPICTDEPPK